MGVHSFQETANNTDWMLVRGTPVSLWRAVAMPGSTGGLHIDRLLCAICASCVLAVRIDAGQVQVHVEGAIAAVVLPEAVRPSPNLMGPITDHHSRSTTPLWL